MKAFAFLIFPLILSIINHTLADDSDDSSDSVSSQLTYDECYDLFMEFTEDEDLFDSPSVALTNFTADLCILMLDDIENGIKPTVCVYTSIIALDYLQEAVLDGADDLGSYADDYCSNINTAVAAKTSFINVLSTMDPTDDDTFDDYCTEAIVEVTNYWFDPVIPSDMITVGDMCDSF
jgi:hypothetical protein